MILPDEIGSQHGHAHLPGVLELDLPVDEMPPFAPFLAAGAVA